MSAQPSKFAFDLIHEPFAITACLWRGAMLDRFARAEHAVLLCLDTIAATGAPLPTDAFHEAAKARLKALISILERDDFNGHSPKALERLRELLALSDDRVALAHGTIRQADGKVLLEWRRCQVKTGPRPEQLTLPLIELTKRLSEIDRLQSELGCRLGQIRKVARDRIS